VYSPILGAVGADLGVLTLEFVSPGSTDSGIEKSVSGGPAAALATYFCW
jgi:hypothetical protein